MRQLTKFITIAIAACLLAHPGIADDGKIPKENIKDVKNKLIKEDDIKGGYGQGNGKGGYGQGNGGFGVLPLKNEDTGPVELFDFVFENINEKGGVFINESVVIDRRVDEAVNDFALNISFFENGLFIPKEKLKKKLSSLINFNAGFGYSLIVAMRMYEWRVVEKLRDVAPDLVIGKTEKLKEALKSGEPVQAKLGNRKLVLLAQRAGYSITIAKNYFERMSKEHQVGLIIHELVSSLIRPESLVADGTVNHTEITQKIFAKLTTAFFLEDRSEYTLLINSAIAGKLPSEKRVFFKSSQIVFPEENDDQDAEAHKVYLRVPVAEIERGFLDANGRRFSVTEYSVDPYIYSDFENQIFRSREDALKELFSRKNDDHTVEYVTVTFKYKGFEYYFEDRQLGNGDFKTYIRWKEIHERKVYHPRTFRSAGDIGKFNSIYSLLKVHRTIKRNNTAN